MGTHEMIVSSPPLEMGQEVGRLLDGGPRATCQCCHPMAEGQIHSLDKSGAYPPRGAQSLQYSFESGLCPRAHHVRDPHQLAPSVTFLHLAVDQACLHLSPTCFPTSTTQDEPVSNMSGEGREIPIEPVTRKEREAARSQELSY
jgi:hypothetical protein